MQRHTNQRKNYIREGGIDMYYEDYLSKALSNIVSSRHALYEYTISLDSKLGKNMKNLSAYHTQQAIELILKYEIYNNQGYNKGSSNFAQIMSHDIDRLIKKYCTSYKIWVPSIIIKNADRYTKWEAGSRYSLGFSVRKDSIHAAIKATEDWLIKINPKYKKQVSIYKNKYSLD